MLALLLSVSVAAQTCPLPQWEPATGLSWTPLDFVVFDDGTGPTIFAVTGLGVEKWTGNQWQSIGSFAFAQGYTVARSLAIYDDGYGGGPSLYVGGGFVSIGGVAANNLARWTGTSWAPVVWGAGQGDGVPIHVYSMQVFNGELYLVGGGFGSASSTGTHGLFRWNGYTMASVIAPGFTCPGGPCTFADSVLLDDGAGPALYLVGPMGFGATPSTNWTSSVITKYDGAAFSPVATTTNYTIYALGAFHDGVSEVLCAGGGFTNLDGVAANGIAARVNGAWAPLGTGLSIAGPGYGHVRNMRSYNDGTGNRLYVVGLFPGAGGITSQGIVSWDGAQWHGVGGGLTGSVQANGWQGYGMALAGFTDGAGSALWVGGTFTGCSGGVQSTYSARRRSASPSIAFDQQAGPGTGVTIHHANLIPGHDYHSLFSFTTCAGGPGTGAFGGLCGPSGGFFLDQFALPLGALPFHFTAGVPGMLLGPYLPIPGTPFSAGAHVEAITFDFTNGVLGCISSVGTLSVQ
jgi:hypothetical protein